MGQPYISVPPGSIHIMLRLACPYNPCVEASQSCLEINHVSPDAIIEVCEDPKDRPTALTSLCVVGFSRPDVYPFYTNGTSESLR